MSRLDDWLDRPATADQIVGYGCAALFVVIILLAAGGAL